MVAHCGSSEPFATSMQQKAVAKEKAARKVPGYQKFKPAPKKPTPKKPAPEPEEARPKKRPKNWEAHCKPAKAQAATEKKEERRKNMQAALT